MEAIRPHSVVTSWSELEDLVLAPPGRKEARRKTLEYLWKWCRCGVFVRVSQGRLVAFVPFANQGFQNNWGLRDLLPANKNDWPQEAQATGALDPESWWCNAGILCTQAGPDVWSTSLFSEFAALFDGAAQWSPHLDAEVFLNKRDFPNVRLDGADPYGATFFGKTERVVNPEELLPVLSCFVGSAFADIPIPLAQDHATEEWFPLWTSWKDFEEDWQRRAPRAIFRGSATGCGCTPELNPRLALLEMTASDPYFDVRITGRNSRIRKHPEEQALRTLPRAEHRERSDWLTLEEQQKLCRFAICIEGHSATGRLAALLRHGFLVFLIDTVVAPANTLYYTEWLRDKEHVVRCRLEQLPEAVRHYADQPRLSARIAWKATRFHTSWLVPSAIEEQLALTLQQAAVA